MMSRAIFQCILVVIWSTLFVLGCAGADYNLPTTPDLVSDQNPVAQSSNRVIWGMWEVSIDRTTGGVDTVPLRGVMFNCNVQQFLSPPFVPTHHMYIELLPETDLVTGYVACDVTLTHPFLGLNMYKGFDVRGIFMADGTKASDHDEAIKYGSVETGEAYMMNADGMTRWWNATEFTDPMPLFAYEPGALGTTPFPTATLNPFKYFADGLDAEMDVADLDTSQRGVFSPSSGPNTRQYQIQFPSDGGIPEYLFNYAVDASWDEPDPIYEPEYPLEAFTTSAQCQEAYYVRVNDDGSDAWFYNGNSGGTLIVNVEVFDWQGAASSTGVPDEVSALWIESPVLVAPIDIFPTATVSPGSITSSVFTAEITAPDLDLTASGEFQIFGSVESKFPNSYQPQLDGGEFFIFPEGPLAAYFIGSITISNVPDTLAPSVTGINPNEGYIDFSYEDVEVTGTNFQNGASVKLVKNDDPLVVVDATSVVVTEPSLITCNLDFDSFNGPAEIGIYDVVVTNPDMLEGQLDDGFEILAYPCAPNEWGENFDSYSTGQYPSGWEMFWSGSTAYVSSSQYYSSPNSFMQRAFSSWARYDGHAFTAYGKTYVCYEAKVMLTNVNKRAILGFAWKKTPSTTGHYGAIVIGNPGEPDNAQPYTWYHVLAKIDMANELWRVWVDGELVREGTVPCSAGYTKYDFTHFFVGLTNFSGGGLSEGYYDDVWLYWE